MAPSAASPAGGGYPSRKGRIAQALLDSPLGPRIYEGLQAVRERKAAGAAPSRKIRELPEGEERP